MCGPGSELNHRRRGGRQGSGGQLGTRQPLALSPGHRGHSNHSVSGEQQLCLCRHCLSVQLLPDGGLIIVTVSLFSVVSFDPNTDFSYQNCFSWWKKQFNFGGFKQKFTYISYCLCSVLFKFIWLLFPKWCFISEKSIAVLFLPSQHLPLPQVKKVTTNVLIIDRYLVDIDGLKLYCTAYTDNETLGFVVLCWWDWIFLFWLIMTNQHLLGLVKLFTTIQLILRGVAAWGLLSI